MRTKENAPVKGSLGTFAGVFTPSVLTILGIILFLRLGYVVGSAGLGQTLIIVGLANLISVLTSFSLAAIATNLTVKKGGDYYLISRTLGLEFGGAIGIVLFIAQSVSIAFYCIGFGEAVAAMTGLEIRFAPQGIAALAVLALFVLAWLGADWATRFQYGVMFFLILALVSFYSGTIMKWDTSVLIENWGIPSHTTGFWILFAIFFPAVTGFTQGVSMSGDLKDPGKSLPVGTFAAVGISIAVYFSVAFLFAAALPARQLAMDYGAMKSISSFGFLIDAGVIAATLSSGMASFLGAPRILQSLAGDRIFPVLKPFAKGWGPADNPRRGVLVSLGIALGTIALGQLDLIARIVSMFFLISYGLLNYATWFEANAQSPSFRPRFRWYDKRLSLLGFLSCLGAMLAIDLKSGLVAIAILASIFQYLKRTSGPARWSDGQRSYHLQQVRTNLLEAAVDPEHPRDWRPYMVVFSDDPGRMADLLILAGWLEGASGMTTAARILPGGTLKSVRECQESRKGLEEMLQQHNTGAYPLVVTAKDFDTGFQVLVQSVGIGPVRSNTLVFHWRDYVDKTTGSALSRNLGSALRLNRNILMLQVREHYWESLLTQENDPVRIDVLWQGDNTSKFMLLLAYLMTRHDRWKEATIRVLSINYPEDSDENAAALRTELDTARIEAEAMIVRDPDLEKIIRISQDSTLVFLPMQLKGGRLTGPFGRPLKRFLINLKAAVVSLASEDIHLDAEPEEGIVQELAATQDAIDHARKRLKLSEKQADNDAEEEKRLINEFEPSGGNFSPDQINQLRKILSARQEADLSARKVLKAQARLTMLESDLENTSPTG